MARVDIFLKKYYTDDHNVDEDLMAIASCGGNWNYRTGTGVMNCDLSNSPNELNHTDVAYKYNKNSTLSKGVEFYMNCLNL